MTSLTDSVDRPFPDFDQVLLCGRDPLLRQMYYVAIRCIEIDPFLFTSNLRTNVLNAICEHRLNLEKLNKALIDIHIDNIKRRRTVVSDAMFEIENVINPNPSQKKPLTIGRKVESLLHFGVFPSQPQRIDSEAPRPVEDPRPA